MGIYLNSKKPALLYRNEVQAAYFVDKTPLLEELVSLLERQGEFRMHTGTVGNRFVCITRPRRFGKTVMANMIASYFGRGMDTSDIFGKLAVGKNEWYKKHLNKHNVIHIMFNEMPAQCKSYPQYISRIEKRLLADLIREFPDAGIDGETAVWDALNQILELDAEVKFIFVFDEWDFIFHRQFVTDADKTAFIDFMSNLLKDQPYVELAYMTGILPIAKYSSGSELNMFSEYTMASKIKYSEYFGFSDEEVDMLFERYLRLTEKPEISREGLRTWYDGYQALNGKKLYNPRSVVCALSDNQLSNYWTSSGPYDELFYYVRKNVDDVRDDIALMAAGESVTAKVQEYAATSMELRTKDEILSAMVVYGFLCSDNGKVFIPNKELMDKFVDMIRKEPSLGYVYRLSKKSEQMLKATLEQDTDTMLAILEYAHNTEAPLLSYSNETELTALVNLVYLAARDDYRVEREDKAGIGYADFIFYPETDRNADGIILELKVNHTAEEALRQIKDKKYALKFERKLGEKRKYTGRILGVGIAYNKETKVHSCKIEVLRSFLPDPIAHKN